MDRGPDVPDVDIPQSGDERAGVAASWSRPATSPAGLRQRLRAWRRWYAVPPKVFPYVGSVMLLLVLVHPFALIPVLEGSMDQRVIDASNMCLLLANVALFGAAVVLKYEWRFSRNPATGWICAMLVMWAAQSLPFSLLAVAGSPYSGFGKVNGFTTLPVWSLMIVMVALAASGRRGPPRNPLLIGVPLGALIGGIRLAFVIGEADPSLRLGPAGAVALQAAMVLLSIVLVIVLSRVEGLPPWVRLRLIVFFALLTASASFPEDDGYFPPPVTRLCLGLLALTVLLGTAVALTRTTFRANAQWLVSLAHRAATAETSVRHGQERLHELNATIAGVAQASRLLVQDGGPTGPRRLRLQQLIDGEMARLERMLSDRAGVGPVRVSVDEVVRPLVAVQRTLGHDVRWTPTDLTAMGRPDDLSEVMHILLANAARHAPGEITTVTANATGDMVEIRVADTGPGVEPWMRRDLFQWGTRRPGSPGQGIGLQLGRRLMIEQGGDLRLESSRRGAVFVVVLPAAHASSLTSGGDPAGRDSAGPDSAGPDSAGQDSADPDSPGRDESASA